MPTSQTPTDQDPVATIHATTTLVEIPLLVLNQNGQIPERTPSPDSIQLRLGDGEWFRPNFVRQEGQDPIELAILLDQTSLVRDIPRPLTQALSSLSSFGLMSRDHVSLYVMDCSSVRVTNIPPDPAQAEGALKSAITAEGQDGKQSCKEGRRLWDTLAAMTRVLQNAHSRRVIVAISEGKDLGSAVSPQTLAEFAQTSAVTILQLNPADNSTLSPQEFRGMPLIAAATGGTRLAVQADSLKTTLRSVVALLRDRYVAQFHLPADEKAGRVAMAARIATAPAGTYQIRVTGNSIPLPNPSETDAVTVQVPQVEAAPAPNPAQPIAIAGPGPTAPSVSAAVVQSQPVSGNATAEARTPLAPKDSSVATLKVNARLTLVDVTVTDSKGHPVHGMTQADFTVKEDGKEQPIKNFEELGSEKALDATTPALPPDVYSNAPASQSTRQAVNILLFDQVSTGISRGLQPSPETLNLLKEDATRYLKTTMPAGTQVAVMAMDGSGLHLLQGFTGDRNLLVAAVSSITHQRVPDAYWAPDPGGPPPCAAANFQSGQALNALNQVALFASGVAGRKNLMWFTPGIPWLTYYPPFADVPRCVVTDYTRQMQQIFGRLTAARVAVYPIDARGLYNDPAQEATAGGRPTSNPIAFSNGVNIDEDSQEATAKATGGKAHYGNNGLGDFLRDDVATGADYYALSYVPPLEKYDGKYHTIEVKVDRPGVQLEYRRG
ncbi:MAG TPA: VWA domain-containing protein, partial [Acidobacteriaceae bacterium]|nr:VWA domain-containing protein [Acidobacteriaceae bacterium]